ncbi:MICOS complex subunit MIC27 isoform X2 [Canis lupus baileyi]|uniref:MICOS complex subunit MIC27 isoform X2 n=1 Tax=Canis lupus baileyi TaxID=143281 RepID=UPI003B97A235
MAAVRPGTVLPPQSSAVNCLYSGTVVLGKGWAKKAGLETSSGRLMGKLTTVPAGLICASITVHAAKEEYKKQLVKPEQLPIYTAPPLQSKYVEEQPGHLQMGFASIRTTTSHYIGWCKGVYVFMKNGIMDTVQFGKGSRFKKIAYPLGLATLGAAVCYPVQSVIIAKVTGKKAYTASEQIYEAVKSLWTKINKKESFPKPKEKPKLGNSAEIEIPAKTADSLKYSVPLPTELISETKRKSESTSGEFFLPVILLSAAWPKTSCIGKRRKREKRKKKEKEKKKKKKEKRRKKGGEQTEIKKKTRGSIL